jgi:hypothetical protein
MATNPYNLRQYDINYFALHVNGRQIPTEGLSLHMDDENSFIMGYRTLFEGAGIHHSNSGPNITPYMYRNGYFMLLFDLTPDKAASEGHASQHDNGNILFELRFAKPLPDPITSLLYLELDTISIDRERKVTKDFVGHAANTVRSARHEIIRGGLPVRSPATLYRSRLYSHNECRSPYREWLALASRPIPAQILECLLL